MNLKTFSLGAIAATAIVAGSSLNSAVEAAVITPTTGDIFFSLNGQIDSVSSTSLDFANNPYTGGSGGTGSFAGFNQITLSDIFFATALTGTASTVNVTGAPTIEFSNGSDSFVFTAQRVVNGIFSSTGFSGLLEGTFDDTTNSSVPASIALFAYANGPVSFGGGQTILGQLTPIPTPALLPGLLALGVGVWRKRQWQTGNDSTEA